MQGNGIFLFKLVYLCTGCLVAMSLIDPCKAGSYMSIIATWVYLSLLHSFARYVFKKVAARGAPFSGANELKYYFAANIFWVLSMIAIKSCGPMN